VLPAAATRHGERVEQRHENAGVNHTRQRLADQRLDRLVFVLVTQCPGQVADQHVPAGVLGGQLGDRRPQ
jgi:hypothetical protein